MRLRLYSAEGASLREIGVPPAASVLLGGEADPGQLLLATRSADPSQSTLYLVDLDSGRIRTVAHGLFPVLSFVMMPAEIVPGAAAAKLFYSGAGDRLYTRDDDRSLVHFDPATGTRRVILRGHSGG